MAEEVEKISPEQLGPLYQRQRELLEQSRAQKQSLQDVLIEFNSAIDALNELKKAGKNDKIMLSLGGGVYIEAVVSDVQKVKGNIGGGVIQSISVDKVLLELEKRKNETIKSLELNAKDEAKLLESIASIELALNALQRANAQKQGNETGTPTVS